MFSLPLLGLAKMWQGKRIKWQRLLVKKAEFFCSRAIKKLSYNLDEVLEVYCGKLNF